MLIRVVVLNFRRSDLTLSCVSDIVTQSYRPLDIVVVDNSVQGSEEDLLRKKLPKGVTLVCNPKNLGYSAGNNVGLRPRPSLHRPDMSLIVNSDVRFLEADTLANLASALNSDSGAVAISPVVVNPVNPEFRNAVQVRRCPTYRDMLVANSCWLRRLGRLRHIWHKHTYQDLVPLSPERIYSCDSINGCCFLIRQDFLESIDYLDEGTFLYYEELILALQIKARDRHCLLHAGESVRHFQGSSSGQSFKKVVWPLFREEIKSQLYLCERYLRCSNGQRNLLRVVRIVDFCLRRAQMVLLDSARLFRQQ
jgi:GT2 family glycosyltransferase